MACGDHYWMLPLTAYFQYLSILRLVPFGLTWCPNMAQTMMFCIQRGEACPPHRAAQPLSRSRGSPNLFLGSGGAMGVGSPFQKQPSLHDVGNPKLTCRMTWQHGIWLWLNILNLKLVDFPVNNNDFELSNDVDGFCVVDYLSSYKVVILLIF